MNVHIAVNFHTSLSRFRFWQTALTDRHNSTYDKAEPEHADAINGGT